MFDGINDLLSDIIFHLPTSRISAPQFGSLGEIISDFVCPLGDLVRGGVVPVQLSILYRINGIVNGSFVLLPLSNFVLDMMGEEKVQEILLQAAVLEGDVEVSDGEVVISLAEEIGSSPGQGVGDSLPCAET